MKLISEKNAEEIAGLETRLINFYNTFTGYPAFSRPSDYPTLWETVTRLAGEISRGGAPCRILEVGAGRSGFGQFLRRAGGSDGRFHLTSQDITSANVDFLRETSDAVVTENINALQGSWDIIFHSYAYEHLCRPREFNEILWSRLSPGGYLAIQSPRYDQPFYFPPCLAHLSVAGKWGVALRCLGRDLASALDGQPRFTVFSDPAVFHLPFHRDRDAVHRVRRSDLRRLFANRAGFAEFALPAAGWKDWIVKTFLTLRVVLHKPA